MASVGPIDSAMSLVRTTTLAAYHAGEVDAVTNAGFEPLAVKLLSNGTLKNYPGLPHGCMTTHPELINRDILDFVRGEARPPADQEKVEVHLEDPTAA